MSAHQLRFIGVTYPRVNISKQARNDGDDDDDEEKKPMI